jgi:chemotaxis protein MotB
LLAFFILSMTMVELEGSTVRRDFQKFQHSLYQQVLVNRQRLGLDWLEVEETVTKGTRLTLRADRLQQQEVFKVGSDKLSSEWQGEMQTLAILLDDLQLNDLDKRYGAFTSSIKASGLTLKLRVLIEGHTDEQPIKSARFPSNWELSTARALQVQQFLQQRTHLPPEQFAIAGLGSFRPSENIADYDRNRRVEIYLYAELLDKDATP